MRHRRVYKMLVASGHSPEFALRVLVEARRGDLHSLRWVRQLRAARRAAP